MSEPMSEPDYKALAKRLSEALRPFAEAAESLDESTRDCDEIWEMAAAMSISAGDLRRASRVLSEQPKP